MGSCAWVSMRMDAGDDSEVKNTYQVLSGGSLPSFKCTNPSDDSLFQRGCFAPCVCAIIETEAVGGTFRLVPAGNDGLYAHYAVTDVNWKVPLQEAAASTQIGFLVISTPPFTITARGPIIVRARTSYSCSQIARCPS